MLENTSCAKRTHTLQAGLLEPCTLLWTPPTTVFKVPNLHHPKGSEMNQERCGLPIVEPKMKLLAHGAVALQAIHKVATT